MRTTFNNYSPFAQALFLVVVGFVTFAVLSMLFSTIAGALFPDLPLNNIQLLMENHAVAFMVLFYLPFQVGLFLVPGIFYYYLEPSSFDWSVFRLKNYWGIVLWGTLLFLCLFLLLPLFAEVNMEVTKWLGVYDALSATKQNADNTLITLFGKEAPTLNYICALLIIGVLTGIAEEFAFRAFLLRHLIRTTGKKWLAIITSGLVFALLHFNYIQLLPLIAFGIALGIIFVVTKSVWLGVVLHATNNLINITWLHQDDFPNWMENSTLVITLPALLLLGFLLYWKRKSIHFS